MNLPARGYGVRPAGILAAVKHGYLAKANDRCKITAKGNALRA